MPEPLTQTRWARVFLLWVCGILAGMQFAKVSVAFVALQAQYGVGPAPMGWVLSSVGLVGLVLGVTMGLFAPAIGYRRLLLGGLGLGALLSAPLGQLLTTEHGWRAGLLGFLALVVFMLPAAWIAGRVDRLSPPTPATGDISAASPRVALAAALRNPSFLVMTAAYFVCGMQLLFITTHLPSYLAICGMDPSLSAGALGAIALFNVFGSLFFGIA